jgi:hypothetical protein
MIGLVLAWVHGCSAPDESPDAAVDVPAVVVPMEVPSRVTVRFEVSGSGQLVVRGRSCRTYEIEREVAPDRFDRVALDLGASCVCDCTGSGTPASIGLTPLRETTPYVVTWDGRHMVSVLRTIQCSTRAFGLTGTDREAAGALQPLMAGRYRVSMVAFSSVPSGCMKLMDGFWCPPSNGTVRLPAGPLALCPGPRVTTTFVLPESGELTVPLRVGL